MVLVLAVPMDDLVMAAVLVPVGPAIVVRRGLLAAVMIGGLPSSNESWKNSAANSAN